MKNNFLIALAMPVYVCAPSENALVGSISANDSAFSFESRESADVDFTTTTVAAMSYQGSCNRVWKSGDKQLVIAIKQSSFGDYFVGTLSYVSPSQGQQDVPVYCHKQ
jgi:hypothetical protein